MVGHSGYALRSANPQQYQQQRAYLQAELSYQFDRMKEAYADAATGLRVAIDQIAMTVENLNSAPNDRQSVIEVQGDIDHAQEIVGHLIWNCQNFMQATHNLTQARNNATDIVHERLAFIINDEFQSAVNGNDDLLQNFNRGMASLDDVMTKTRQWLDKEARWEAPNTPRVMDQGAFGEE